MIPHFHPLPLIITVLLFPLFTTSNPNLPPTSRHLLSYNGDTLATDPRLDFENPRLRNAYIALQAWKDAILSDPNNITASWEGPDPCSYFGVYCWPAPDDTRQRTVAGIDLNRANLAGHLPHELGLLYDLAVLHLNSNRFCGKLPETLASLHRLHELDLSNNRFAGPFPALVLEIKNLKYLDLRYNEFEGGLPPGLFAKNLDAIFVNDNRFSSPLPDNIGNSPASVVVLANNDFQGCMPSGLGNMRATLNELVITNNGLSSCFSNEIGRLTNLTVLDVSWNRIVGPLPDSIGDMSSLVQLNVGHNLMSGNIPAGICRLAELANFLYEDNYFTEEGPACLGLAEFDDKQNCFRGRPEQRAEEDCRRFLGREVNCTSFGCGGISAEAPSPVGPPAADVGASPPETGLPPSERCDCQCAKPPSGV